MYCSEIELYNFLKLKLPFQDIKEDLSLSIQSATLWITAQVNKEIPENLLPLAKEACLFYAATRILMQYWEQLQIDEYKREKIEQYEKRSKELVQALIYGINKVQDVIDDKDLESQKFILVLDYSITE